LIILLAVQAFDAVLDHQFVLSHHHVHGPVPLTLVGVPEAQVGIGVATELNGALQEAGVPQDCIALLIVPQATPPLAAGVEIV
jgi:hypothetical protein